ncbi:MAG: DUF427 domain-containing protein [Chloroflexi bacterium]|nr:MAG: DUF427 domain-containing protein [Chloroflexota bacterium]
MVDRIEPKAGQESVWDYPKPPILEATEKRIRIVFNGVTIADSTRALRTLQTGIPPVYYIPQEDIKMEYLERTPHHSTCEFKGHADYWTITVGDRSAKNVGWSYPDPWQGYEAQKDMIAFYAHLVDEAWVDDELATGPDWKYLGGWVTSEIVGPFITRERAAADHS